MRLRWFRATTALGVVATTALATGVSTAAPMNADTTETWQEFTLSGPVELVHERTATSKTFLQPDGSFTTETYPAPVHYRDPSGGWYPIDNRLVDSAEPGYLVENRANEYSLLIPQNPEGQPVKVVAADEWVAFTPVTAEGTPDIQGAQATIAGLPGDAQLSYEATNQGVKETILLAAPPSGPASWSFTLDTSHGLTPRITPDGGMEFTDPNGQIIFRTPPPFMVDSSGADQGYSADVEFGIVQEGQAWRLTVTADQDWLLDPDRVYPVEIDPTVTTDPPSKDCWISQHGPNSSYCGMGSDYLRVGVDEFTDARRSLLKFDLSGLPSNVNVSRADLELYLDSSQSTSGQLAEYVPRRITQGWTPEATWNTFNGTGKWATPGGDFVGSMAGRELNGSTSGYKTFDVTPIVSMWLEQSELNSGLLIKQRSEDTENVLFFHSANSAFPGRMPRLTLEYTQLTDTVVLAATDRVVVTQSGNTVFHDYTSALSGAEQQTYYGEPDPSGGCIFEGSGTVDATQFSGLIEERELSINTAQCVLRTETGEPSGPTPLDSDDGTTSGHTVQDQEAIDEGSDPEINAGAGITVQAFHRTYFEDPPGKDVTSVRTNVRWTFGGGCVQSSTHPRTRLAWFVQTGWFLVNSNTTSERRCAFARTTNTSTFHNRIFCATLTITRFDVNEIRGLSDGRFRWRWRWEKAGLCSGLLSFHRRADLT